MSAERKLIGTCAECASWKRCTCNALSGHGDCSHLDARGQVPKHTLETFGCIYFSEASPEPEGAKFVEKSQPEGCEHDEFTEMVRCDECGAYGVVDAEEIRWLPKGTKP